MSMKALPEEAHHEALPDDESISIMMRARYIRSGDTVTKFTGRKRYTLQRRIIIVGADGVRDRVIDGLFLTDGGSYINSIDPDTLLSVQKTPESFAHDHSYFKSPCWGD